MRCLRCGNSDDRYFYKDKNKWYCRKCISFGRINVNELPVKCAYQSKMIPCDYHLKYPLTANQLQASKEICMHTLHHQNVLVYAVCGARQNRIGNGSHKTLP